LSPKSTIPGLISAPSSRQATRGASVIRRTARIGGRNLSDGNPILPDADSQCFLLLEVLDRKFRRPGDPVPFLSGIVLEPIGATIDIFAQGVAGTEQIKLIADF